jgi:hypothetical protein
MTQLFGECHHLAPLARWNLYASNGSRLQLTSVAVLMLWGHKAALCPSATAIGNLTDVGQSAIPQLARKIGIVGRAIGFRDFALRVVLAGCPVHTWCA